MFYNKDVNRAPLLGRSGDWAPAGTPIGGQTDG